MAAVPSKLVLFLDDGPLSRDAFTRFEAIVVKLKMPWRAECRSLEPESSRFAEARFVVGFVTPVDAPENFELWPGDPDTLDDEVNDLVARLFTGTKRSARPKVVVAPAVASAQPKAKKAHTVKLGRETKGRRGKGVTLLTDLPPEMSELDRAELTTFLKTRCGTGGTLRDGSIEIQGDQRDRLTVELEKLGYKVKRVGG